MAECPITSGDRLDAKEVLAAAKKQVHAWAQTIEDPGGRQALPARIPEHRRVLELADDLATCKS